MAWLWDISSAICPQTAQGVRSLEIIPTFQTSAIIVKYKYKSLQIQIFKTIVINEIQTNENTNNTNTIHTYSSIYEMQSFAWTLKIIFAYPLVTMADKSKWAFSFGVRNCCFYRTQVQSLPCLLTRSLNALCKSWLVTIVTRISQSCYMDLSKLIHGSL